MIRLLKTACGQGARPHRAKGGKGKGGHVAMPASILCSRGCVSPCRRSPGRADRKGCHREPWSVLPRCPGLPCLRSGRPTCRDRAGTKRRALRDPRRRRHP